MLKKEKLIVNNLDMIDDICRVLSEIQFPSEEDFEYMIERINKIENNLFYIDNTFIEHISTIRKALVHIERYLDEYYNFKYLLFEVLADVSKAYKKFLEKKEYNFEIESINEKIIKLQKKIVGSNKLKNFFFLKFSLDNKVPYFYLSRRYILSRLKESGRYYNYFPDSLDDDRYSYFSTDFKTENKKKLNVILKELEEDEAIKNIQIFKLVDGENIYSLRFYLNIENDILVNKISKEFNNENILNLNIYEKRIDLTLKYTNQINLIKKINSLNEKSIDIVLIKNIDNSESRILALNGVNIENIYRIKKVIEYLKLDKKIIDLMYNRPIDFFGIQFLEFLKKEYKIENLEINKSTIKH